MPFTTYTELKAAIIERADRDDWATSVVDFIALAEDEFNSSVFVPEREGVSTATASAETLALPSDFYRLRSLIVDSTDPKVVLQQMTISDLKENFPSDTATGQPRYFAIQKGSELVFGPVPDTSYTVLINYYQKITPLSGSVATNWLLTNYPRIYFYGSLLQSNISDDDPRVSEWKQKYALAVGQLQSLGHKKAWAGSRARTDLGSGQPFNINTG